MQDCASFTVVKFISLSLCKEKLYNCKVGEIDIAVNLAVAGSVVAPPLFISS